MDTYELLDSGNGEKLERFGDFVLRRPEPSALWGKYLSDTEWNHADGVFVREGKNTEWKLSEKVPTEWEVRFQDLTFLIKPTSSKHTGLFPEQAENWKYIEKMCKDKKPRVLNLFAYTGAATLAAARAGAEVTHVDAAKPVVEWARKNAELNGLGNAPIRWLVDDCMDFVKKEIKRGNKYDGIIMDPPAFGHGPDDELWKIEEDFMKLLELCTQLLSEEPLFIQIAGYAAGYSPIAYEQCLRQALGNRAGNYESGELLIPAKSGSHVLPSGIFARWSRE